jgi:hypothetical protein
LGATLVEIATLLIGQLAFAISNGLVVIFAATIVSSIIYYQHLKKSS